MIHAFTISGEIEHAIKAETMNLLADDIASFAKLAHIDGKRYGKPRHVLEVIDNTVYDESEGYSGVIKVYIQLDKPDWRTIDDICSVLQFRGVTINGVVRKWVLP